jgi:hypothetical protein
MTDNAVTGDRYDSGRDVADIAKAVRKDLATAYPRKDGWKFSVRISRFSMGCSLGVTVKAVPDGFNIHTDDWRAAVAEGGHCKANDRLREPGFERFTAEAKETKEALERLANRYTYRDIDSMTDYFNVSCWVSAEWDNDLERADEGKPLAAPPEPPELKRAKKDVDGIFTTLEEATAKEAAELAAAELASHPGRPALRLVPSKARSMPDPVTIEPKRPPWWPEEPAPKPDADANYRDCLAAFLGEPN